MIRINPAEKPPVPAKRPFYRGKKKLIAIIQGTMIPFPFKP